MALSPSMTPTITTVSEANAFSNGCLTIPPEELLPETSKLHPCEVQKSMTETGTRIQIELAQEQYEDNISDNEDDDKPRLTYTYHLNDTYLHSLFGNETAIKIIEFYHGLFFKIFVSFNLIFYAQLFFISPSFYHRIPFKALRIFYWIFVILAQIINISIVSLYSLSINRKLFKTSLKSFEFWFKTLTCISGVALFMVYSFVQRDIYEEEFPFFNGLNRIVIGFEAIFGIVCYSLIDGFQLPFKLKLLLSIGIALGATGITLLAVFVLQPEYDHTVIIIHPKWLKFSVYSAMLSNARVLTIFIWRQTLKIYMKRGRCVNIRYSPYIKWVQ